MLIVLFRTLEAKMSDPRLEKLNQVCKATRAIGFATGALEILAIVAQGLNADQRQAITQAIDGLRDVDVLELACLSEKADDA
jgi:hypothetical protein